MRLGDLAVEFHMLDSVHGFSVFSSLLVNGIHIFRIFPHHLGQVLPQWLLGCGDIQRALKLLDLVFRMIDGSDSGPGVRFLFS